MGTNGLCRCQWGVRGTKASWKDMLVMYGVKHREEDHIPSYPNIQTRHLPSFQPLRCLVTPIPHSHRSPFREPTQPLRLSCTIPCPSNSSQRLQPPPTSILLQQGTKRHLACASYLTLECCPAIFPPRLGLQARLDPSIILVPSCRCLYNHLRLHTASDLLRPHLSARNGEECRWERWDGEI